MKLFFLLPIVTIPVFIIKIVKAKYTKFSLWTKSIDYKYEFLNTKYNSFSVDRVTEVIFKESILDKWLWTCSVIFYSIWSNTPMIFEDITKTPELLDNILSKVWIYKTWETQKIAIAFNFGDFLKSNIFINSFLTIFFWITIFPYFYYKLYYSNRFYSN